MFAAPSPLPLLLAHTLQQSSPVFDAGRRQSFQLRGEGLRVGFAVLVSSDVLRNGVDFSIKRVFHALNFGE